MEHTGPTTTTSIMRLSAQDDDLLEIQMVAEQYLNFLSAKAVSTNQLTPR